MKKTKATDMMLHPATIMRMSFHISREAMVFATCCSAFDIGLRGAAPEGNREGGLGIKVRVVRCKREKAIQKREVLAPHHEGKGESGRKGHTQNTRKSRSARSGTRTRTTITGQGILSPSCLPFHHSGGFPDCKGKGKWRNIQQFSPTFTDFSAIIA